MGVDDASQETESPSRPDAATPSAASIELTVNGQSRRLSYEQAFALACGLLENGRVDDASKVFSRLEEFADRGPRAFVMHAFCESAGKHFDASKVLLDAAFEGEDARLAGAINDAFVYYHVAGRQEGMRLLGELIDKHDHLPTLCLLLGNLVSAAGNATLARRCWSLAVHRDRKGGAVAAVAMRHLRK
ncbi:MAG TPA: hypothetical protein VF175_16125, partial [Lacipirellula sp.]